jgi:hypothetical protein
MLALLKEKLAGKPERPRVYRGAACFSIELIGVRLI